MKITERHIVWVAVLALFFAGCVAPTVPTPSTEGKTGAAPTAAGVPATGVTGEPLVLWHTWQEPELSIFQEVAANYHETTGFEVEFVQMQGSDFLEKVTEAIAAGEPPDILAGSHLWGDALLENGFASAYCLPDGCPECEGPNPPRWCLVANSDFTWGRNDDFPINAMCIDPESCRVCMNANPPRWCRFADQSFEPKLDVLQGSFAYWVDDFNRPFPLGIPVWWDFVGFSVNLPVLEAQGFAVPTQFDEAVAIARESGIMFYVDPDLASLAQELALPQDPISLEEAGIFLLPSNHFVQVQNEVSELMPILLKGYQPTLYVQGLYMNAQTKQRAQALDLMYALADEEVQRVLFDKTGHLPAHGEILAQAGEGSIGTLIELGKTALPAGEN